MSGCSELTLDGAPWAMWRRDRNQRSHILDLHPRPLSYLPIPKKKFSSWHNNKKSISLHVNYSSLFQPSNFKFSFSIGGVSLGPYLSIWELDSVNPVAANKISTLASQVSKVHIRESPYYLFCFSSNQELCIQRNKTLGPMRKFLSFISPTRP